MPSNNYLGLNVNDFIKNYHKGESLRSIAKRYKTSHAVISGYLKRANIKIYKNIGERHHMYKGHRRSKSGYIMIKHSNHPRADKLGYVLEHIIIMEQYLGRYLKYYGKGHKDNEEIHHKNEIKNDNRISNLEIKTRSQHIKDHKRIFCPKIINQIRNEIKKRGDQRKLALKYGVAETTISGIKLKRTYKD